MTTRRLCYLTQAAPNHAGSRQAAGRVLNGRRRRLRWRWQRQAWVMMTNDKKRVSEVRCDKWIDGSRMITDSNDSVRIGNRIFARSLANNCHSWWSVPNGRRPSCETLYLRYIDRIFDHDFDLHKVRSFSAILQPQICCVFDFQLKGEAESLLYWTHCSFGCIKDAKHNSNFVKLACSRKFIACCKHCWTIS